MERRTVRPGEHIVVCVLPPSAHRQSQLDLPGAPSTQHLDSRWVEVKGTPVARLCWADHNFGPGHGPGLSDHDVAGVEVDIAPLHTQGFASTAASQRQEPEDRVVLARRPGLTTAA